MGQKVSSQSDRSYQSEPGSGVVNSWPHGIPRACPAAFSSLPTPRGTLAESDVGAMLPPHPCQSLPLACCDGSTAACQDHLLPVRTTCFPPPPPRCWLSTPRCLVLMLSPARRVDFIPKTRGGVSETASFLSIHAKCPAPHRSTVPSLRSDSQPLWSSLCDGRVLKRTLRTGVPLPVSAW